MPKTSLTSLRSYLELPIEVKYTHTPGSTGDYFNPEDPGSIEIDAVLLAGIDVTAALDSNQLEILETDCWQQVEKQTELA